MDSKKAQELFLKNSTAMAYVAVIDEYGDERIGSAFHVGEGVFVTARHVVENKRIKEIRISEFVRIPYKDAIPEATDEAIEVIRNAIGIEPKWPIVLGPLEIDVGPLFHSDSRADIAVFRVKDIHPKVPYVPLGEHLDDWIPRANWALTEAIVLGYPPIPMSSAPTLVGARAEVNAYLWPRHSGYAHFILSSMPRGGFSGGLALSELGFALGVITESLTMDHNPVELGFQAVLSVEPILQCLGDHKLLHDVQKGRWGDFWNTLSTHYLAPPNEAGGRLAVAALNVHDDGRSLYIEVISNFPELLQLTEECLVGVLSEGPPFAISKDERRIRASLEQPALDDSKLSVDSASRAVSERLKSAGYEAMPLIAERGNR